MLVRPPGASRAAGLICRGLQLLAALCALASGPARSLATEQPPALILRGSLSGADHQTWRLVPFDVPTGTTRISVDFEYTTRQARTTIDLGVLGPDGLRGQDGFRGFSGGNKRHFTLSATDATPSYLPGPIRPGRWSLLLGIPNIRPGTQAEYTATVRFGRDAEPGPVLRAVPGWYRGDLHMHTAHSDGSCLSRRGQRVPCPVFLTAQTASARHLDFIAITDHNTISHADAIRELQPYFDDLLLITGREITTFQGHANLLGNLELLDFRIGKEAGAWNALVRSIAAGGGVLSINHPVRPSGEQCMGCGWTPTGDVDYALIQAVEVVNGLDADTPFSGIGFWERLLERGYQLTALGGSDNHDALQPAASAASLPQAAEPGAPAVQDLAQLQRRSGAIGTPTTVVYAQALSQEAILAGIRSGRVFIDVEGTLDRMLDLTAAAGQQSAHMGDTLKLRQGTEVHFAATVQGVSGGEAWLIFDGRHVPWLADSHLHESVSSLAIPWRADGNTHWLRLDVRDAASHLVLVGNPIYLQGDGS